MKTLQQIHEDIEACQDRLEEIVEDLFKAGPADAAAESKYKAAWAQEFLSAKMGKTDLQGRISDELAKAHATQVTEDLYREHLAARSLTHVLREVRQALLEKLETGAKTPGIFVAVMASDLDALEAANKRLSDRLVTTRAMLTLIAHDEGGTERAREQARKGLDA